MMHRWTEQAGGRASWRARRLQRRGARANRRAARWASWGPWGDGCGAGMDEPAEVQDSELGERIATMKQTIETLESRIAVLEKLATADTRQETL